MDISNQISQIYQFIATKGYTNAYIRNYKLKLDHIANLALTFPTSNFSKLYKYLEAKFIEEKNEGKLTNNSFKLFRRILLMLTELEENGVLLWNMYNKTLPNTLNSFYTDKFIKFKNSNNSLRRKANYIKSFFQFLQDSGIDNYINAKPDDLIEFIKLKSEKLTARSMEDFLSVIKVAKSFFGNNFAPTLYFTPILFKRKCPPRKVCVPFEQTNVLKLLENINTDNGEGLRDFAIILLGACLGIRACDIIKLKLADFNWKDKVLYFVQHKTGKPQILPIDGVVGDAVAAYILNGRPESQSKFVFLRTIPPYYPLKDGVSISAILRKRLKHLGIHHCKGDGMTFHGLRRSIATEMVKEGTPVSIVAEVLGHSNIIPTRQYISLDFEYLRKCALDLLFPKGNQ